VEGVVEMNIQADRSCARGFAQQEGIPGRPRPFRFFLRILYLDGVLPAVPS